MLYYYLQAKLKHICLITIYNISTIELVSYFLGKMYSYFSFYCQFYSKMTCWNERVVTTSDCSADDQAHDLPKLGPIQKFLSTYHTRRWDISLNFLIPTYCYELKEIWNHVHNADAMALSFHHGLDSIYMKDLVDWPLMTTKNIKFMTKQDHLLRNFITGMSSSEQPFFL